jgi:prolipoprotein diacylglyceryl transferase
MYVYGYIIWSVSPEIFSTTFLTLRWYGLLFALAFITGQNILLKIFIWEKQKLKYADYLAVYVIIGTIVGARLGHCLFYDSYHYLRHPFEIIKIWEGGLASHGAAIGILVGVYLFIQKYVQFEFLWILDRLSIVTALGGFFIRIGNLFNSEIIGLPTQLPWGFIFKNVDNIPRHPAQLYEAVSCFILFFILFNQYKKYKENTPDGKLFGIFLFVIFTLRFFYEFIKENQSPFETALPLNMGQLLSIPLIIGGLYLIFRSKRKEHSISKRYY